MPDLADTPNGWAEDAPTDCEPLMSTAEVGVYLGVTLRQVRHLYGTNADFPKPHQRLREGLRWRRLDIEEFAALHWDHEVGKLKDRGCSISGCTRRHKGHGLCNTHLERQKRSGSTEDPGPRYADAAERLAVQAVRSGACILFTGGSKTGKYGHRRISYRGKGEQAHRVAWILARGAIPDGLCVLHKCDVPNCINVDHLFLGTQLDNIADRDAKGRQVAHRGSKASKAKLAEWQVQEIFRKLAAGQTCTELGAEYGVLPESIGRIRDRRNWRHVTVPELGIL